jgi:hypothetical protein
MKRIPYSMTGPSSVYARSLIGYENMYYRITDERRKFSYYIGLFLTRSGKLPRLNPVNSSILEYVSEY